jgi:hypothetical protein
VATIPGVRDPDRTLAEIKEIWATQPGLRLAKAENVTTGITTGTGIYGYPLEKPAKNLFSDWTWFVQNLSREQSPNGGLAQHWVAVDGIMSGGWDAGVAEGAAGAYMVSQTSNHLAQYKTLGRNGQVTFEAISAAQSFDDALALETVHTLQNLRMSEEASIIGGCTSGISAPGTITATGTTGGSLASATTYYFAVSAFTLLGSSVLTGNTQVTGHGSADAPYETTATTGSAAPGGTNTAIKLTWASVKGAVGYNVYVGTTSSVQYQGTVTVPTYTITSTTATSSNVPNSANQTASALQYDGILTQAALWTPPVNLGSYSNFVDLAAAPFTSDNAGGIVEIDNALQAQFAALKVSFDLLVLSPQDAVNVRKKILTAGSTGASRFMRNVGEDGTIRGGSIFAAYYNPVMPTQAVDVLVHPYMPQGTALGVTRRLPPWYPNANISTTWAIDARREYYSVDFALTSRTRQFGTFVEEVLKGYFPGGTIVFSGIGNG